MKRYYFILVALIVSLSAWAGFVRTPYEGVRPTGMGNAFIAVADDQNALFYNPAGLARIKGAHSNFLDFIGGADSWTKFSNIWNAVFDSGNYDDVISLDGKHFARFGLFPSFVTKYFGLSFYSNVQAFAEFGGLNIPEVDVYFANDLGVIGGIGIPFGKLLSVGVSVRVMQRTGYDNTVTPADLLAEVGVNQSDFSSAIGSHLGKKAGMGWGIGINAGAILEIPMPLAKKGQVWRLAATVEDFLDTDFTALGGRPAPDAIPASYHFGTSMIYPLSKTNQLTIAVDMRNVFSGIPIHKMSHLGAELKVKTLSLRLGAYQGYLTGGISITALPHTRLHFSTYAMELGESIWERSCRFFLAQISIGFNPL